MIMDDNYVENHLTSSIEVGYSLTKQKSIPHQLSIVAERMNRTMMVKVRTMIIGVGLTQELWENVVDTTCYLVNSSSPMALVNKIPYEACASKNPSLTHIRLFGCHSFVHVPKEKITKINSKSEKCIFIWYMDRVKGYKL